MPTTHLKAIIFALITVWFNHRTAFAVVNGVQTNISMAPFMAQIWYDGSFICGGTLISNYHVLTAAQCVKGTVYSKIRVHVGTGTLKRNGTVRAISKALISQIYNDSTKTKDVAVLKLARAVNGTNIEPIGLCSTLLTAGKRLHLYGWGTTSKSSSETSNVLHTAAVSVVGKAVCQTRYQGIQTLTRTMFCAGPKRGSCYGDSGGPLIYNNTVCGIVSFGNACGSSIYPGVYTSVPKVRQFIVRGLAL